MISGCLAPALAALMLTRRGHALAIRCWNQCPCFQRGIIGQPGTVIPGELDALAALARHRNAHVELSAVYAISGFRATPVRQPGEVRAVA